MSNIQTQTFHGSTWAVAWEQYIAWRKAREHKIDIVNEPEIELKQSFGTKSYFVTVKWRERSDPK